MSRKNKRLLFYLVILLVVLSLIFFQNIIFESFKMYVVGFISSPLDVIVFPLREIKKIVFYHVTYDRYMKLKGEVGDLKNRLLSQEEVIRENSRLRELLNLKKTLIFSSVTAQVVGRDPSNWHATFIIDRGERDGIKKGMPVVAFSGIVGRVVEVGMVRSKVMLLNDPNFSVAAVIERSREAGLLTGTLQGICRLRYLSPEADVEIGDQVITSKLSTIFPEGLMIGRVVRIEESQTGPTLDCFVEPSVSLSRLEEVLVIKR